MYFLFRIDTFCAALGIYLVSELREEFIGRGGGFGQWATEAKETAQEQNSAPSANAQDVSPVGMGLITVKGIERHGQACEQAEQKQAV